MNSVHFQNNFIVIKYKLLEVKYTNLLVITNVIHYYSIKLAVDSNMLISRYMMKNVMVCKDRVKINM